MLDQAPGILGRGLETVIAAAGYVSILDLPACAERPVELIARVHENDDTQAKDKGRSLAATQAPIEPPIDEAQFTWCPEEQTDYWPQCHGLRHIRGQRKRRRQDESAVMHQYRCAAEECQECLLKSRWDKAPSRGRIVIRTEGEEQLERTGGGCPRRRPRG